MKKHGRILSMLLAVLLIAAMFSVSVFALGSSAPKTLESNGAEAEEETFFQQHTGLVVGGLISVCAAVKILIDNKRR